MFRAVQEAQRAKQREEFRQAKKTKTVAEHPHATKRVLQVSEGNSSLQTVKISVRSSRALPQLSFENRPPDVYSCGYNTANIPCRVARIFALYVLNNISSYPLHFFSTEPRAPINQFHTFPVTHGHKLLARQQCFTLTRKPGQKQPWSS